MEPADAMRAKLDVVHRGGGKQPTVAAALAALLVEVRDLTAD
jgi:hypothetical protein